MPEMIAIVQPVGGPDSFILQAQGKWMNEWGSFIENSPGAGWGAMNEKRIYTPLPQPHWLSFIALPWGSSMNERPKYPFTPFPPTSGGDTAGGRARRMQHKRHRRSKMKCTSDTTREGHGPGACARAPRRIKLSRKRGYRKPQGAVTVARPTFWGNPWVVGVHGDRSACVDAHADWLAGLRDDAPGGRSANEVLSRIGELRGKDLACWCDLGGPCHADVLLKLANRGGQ